MHESMGQGLRNLGLIALAFIGWALGCAAPARRPANAPANGQAAQNASQPSRPSKASNWVYDEDADKMGRGIVKESWTTSLNSVNFDFPYAGDQYARLTLRTHPQYGKDVILSIEKGQFLCPFDGCSVLVRFDEGKAERYGAVEPADYSTTALFIRGFDKFVTNAKRSKKVMIEAPFYKEGTRVFEFAVEGLEWEKSAPGTGK